MICTKYFVHAAYYTLWLLITHFKLNTEIVKHFTKPPNVSESKYE